MNRRSFIQLAAGACAVPALNARPANRPNIVMILADDVGYGDLGCYGATKVRTPNLDRLAEQGLRFTDAHSSAATCTPSRYSIMTGEYAWRKRGTGVLPGDANLIVDYRRGTTPSILRQAGYKTGCVGKWHLGLGDSRIDWNQEIKPGPREVGFDYSFIIPATGDRVPCVYVEDGRVVALDPNDPITVDYAKKVGNWPTGRENPELLQMKLSNGHDMTIVNGISRIGWMTGGKSALWEDTTIAQTLTEKATGFIDRNQKDPFFLYFATHDIHVPRVPNPAFAGKSMCGVRCDAIAQLDWSVGQVLAALDRNGLAKDTLVIFTSDNGPVVDDGYADGAVENLNGHVPAGPFRGTKYSIYEGGTRMPFLARWPGKIRPGISDALVGQIDLMASFAAMTGAKVPQAAGPDSQNVLPALLGKSKKGREWIVEQARGTALRKGQWKYVPKGSEGAGRNRPGGAATDELYNLASDIRETNNVAAQHPDIVKEMAEMLGRIRGKQISQD